jgi:hypothetical protein
MQSSLDFFRLGYDLGFQVYFLLEIEYREVRGRRRGSIYA